MVQKKQAELDANQIKVMGKNIEKLAGPMERKWQETTEQKLRMTSHFWWDDFVGPDMVKFFNSHPSSTRVDIAFKILKLRSLSI